MSIDIAISLRNFLVNLTRPIKQLVSGVADFFGFAVCTILVSWLIEPEAISTADAMKIALIASGVAVPLLWYRGLYRSVVRYLGLDLFVAGFQVALATAALVTTAGYAFDYISAPSRWAFAFWALSFLYVTGSRYMIRVFLLQATSRRQRERVIIYGAGDGGAQLALALSNGNAFLVVAIIDDDPALHGKIVKGIDVYAPGDLETLIDETRPTRILLAIPSASRRKRRKVLEQLSEFPVHVQTIPNIAELVSGEARVDDIQDVDVADILGRDPVPPDPRLLWSSIEGKVVMVTGAGGSIGSELCRQILRLRPHVLLLFEISEIALYNIEMELRDIAKTLEFDCEVIPLLGSVHHENRVGEVLRTFDVDIVYHAAAYKHVPVVEQNLLEGVHNNIFGTLHTARAAIDAGVGAFVLVSSDKAVSPTSVMGATKRFSELVLQALQEQHNEIRFCMVRFGNVLESSGSVVPLFRNQIRNGGPVTVTHRDVIRYFMTIPEAAELVIQAGTMANGGEVFVLDMGRPVKIIDLAVRMINLMGLTVRDDDNPDGDIEIEYTGLRPAEKLFEELLIGTDVSGTQHPRILRANEAFIPMPALELLIEELKSAALKLDRKEAREILQRAITGYGPSNGIEDLVWVGKNSPQDKKPSDKVIDFTTRRA